MNKKLERILIASAIVGLLAAYGLVGTSDMQAEQEDAAYTAEIMEAAKQEALNRQRAEQWHNLNKQAAEMLALGEIK